MNKIIKTHHTPFWNPLETFSSWIRSIRAKVEKQLPHINTLWVFSLCLNLRTLPAIEKSLQLRRAELDEQDKQEFLVWLKENSSYQFFIQLLGEQQQANMFIIWSPFSRANSTEAFGNHACMHLKWRKVGSRKMIMSAFFFFRLRKPYRCECFLFQNISVTLALSIPMPFQFEALYSVSSHQKHVECFARFRSY